MRCERTGLDDVTCKQDKMRGLEGSLGKGMGVRILRTVEMWQKRQFSQDEDAMVPGWGRLATHWWISAINSPWRRVPVLP